MDKSDSGVTVFRAVGKARNGKFPIQLAVGEDVALLDTVFFERAVENDLAFCDIREFSRAGRRGEGDALLFVLFI